MLLSSAGASAQGLSCPGFDLGKATRKHVLDYLAAANAPYTENTEGLKCKAKSTVINTGDALTCDTLPSRAAASGVMIAQPSGKVVAVTYAFPYDAGLHQRIQDQLQRRFERIDPAQTPRELLDLVARGELSAAYRAPNQLIWVTNPPAGITEGGASTVIFAAQKFVDLARTDLRRCQ
ncbi:MAG: hypothetical protein ABI612_16575 [Betaproteobacteria bacterium]